MVAYSFQPQFVAPILSGRKCQTVRAHGKRRHARVGERLQIYTGMRTRSCRLQGVAECNAVEGIEMRLTEAPVVIVGAISHRDRVALDVFAQLDGFEHWNALVAFWRKHHPGVDVFDGVLIGWRDFAPSAEAA